MCLLQLKIECCLQLLQVCQLSLHVPREGMQLGRCLLLLLWLARERRHVLGLCWALLSCKARSFPRMLHGQHSFLQRVLQGSNMGCAGPGWTASTSWLRLGLVHGLALLLCWQQRLQACNWHSRS